MIVPATPQQIRRAAELLAGGALVAFPTETVYGLGADARSREAVRKVYEAKGRPSNNPLILHLPSADKAAEWANLSDPLVRRRFDRVRALWPGPLTVVVPKSGAVIDEVAAGLPTVALRVPAHPVAQALLEAAGFPIAAPSANVSTYISPTTAQHVEDGLAQRVALILDGGACRVGLESTIVALSGARPRVLRYGAVTIEQLTEALGETVETPPSGTAQPIEAPGMSARHYSPRTPVRFRAETAKESLAGRVGLITFDGRSGSGSSFDYAKVSTLSTKGELDDVARGLFAALREHDKLGLDLILVDDCPEEGVGRAIMDRLKRAAFRQ